MFCCLIGGGLVAWLARSARRHAGQPVDPGLGLLLGFGVGALVVALIINLLVPLGVVDVTGPLAARIALLVVPAVAAGVAVSRGGAGSLLNRSGTTALTVAAVAGALAVEERDAAQVVAGLAVHLPGFVFLAAGLAWRAKLPAEEPVPGGCDCPPAIPKGSMR